MEQADLAKRYVEIIDSGADLATMEAEFARMALEMGFPPDLATRWASLLMQHGRDPERFALEQTRLLTAYASEQLAAEQDGTPEGAAVAAMMPELQRVMEGIHGASALIDGGSYAAAIEAADSVFATIADIQARFATLPGDGTDPNPFAEDGVDNPIRLIRAQLEGIVGIALLKLGKFADALTRFDSAIAVLEPIPERAQATVPKLLMARSGLAMAVGDLQGAIHLSERAVAARMREIGAACGDDAALAARVTESDLDLANLHDSLACQCMQAGDTARAIALQERAIAAYGHLGSGGVNTRTALAVARCLQNRAVALQSTGAQAEEVLAVLASAMGVYEAHQLESHPECILCLENIGTIHWFAGNIMEAATAVNRAATALEKQANPDHAIGARLLHLTGWIMASAGVSDQALEALQTSCEMQGEIILRVLPAASEAQRLQFLEGIRRHLDTYLSLVVQRFQGPGRAAADALKLVLQRKGLVADASAAQRLAVLSAHNEALAPLLSELLDLERRIADLASRPPTDGDYEGQAAMLAGLQAEHGKLEITLAGRIPQIAFERRLFTAEASTIAEALPEGSALLEFVRYRSIDFDARISEGEPMSTGERYAALVLPSGSGSTAAVVDLGDAESIDALIGAWRSELTGEADEAARHGSPLPMVEGLRGRLRKGRFRSGVTTEAGGANPIHGQSLRERLFDPCLQALANRQRLLIAPDSEIARVPFEALPDRDGGQLIDHFVVSYVPTGRSVLRFRPADEDAPAASTALVMADPDYDLGGARLRAFRKNEPFERLWGTLDEGERIARSLGVTLISAGHASRTRFTSEPLPSIVHVATHGFFEPAPEPGPDPAAATPIRLPGTSPFGPAAAPGAQDNPMLRSGLALAGANVWVQGRTSKPGVDTGILTAADVAGLDLFATELVVLSACETGLGDVRAGDGVYGLRRAFAVAGARALVMSLWQVPDEQTCELMGDFYGRLRAGRPVAIALREAQLALKSKYADPVFWGAFVCEGDPGPLRLT